MEESGFVVATLDMEADGTLHVHCPPGHRYDVAPLGEVQVSEDGNLVEANYADAGHHCKVCGAAL